MNLRTLTAAALALALAGCAQEAGGVGIYAICAPPAPTTSAGGGSSCEYAATCAATLVGNARLDATTARLDFRLPLQFSNLLEDNSSTAEGRVNTNTAQVQSLEINYSGPSYAAPWSVPVALTVPTTGSAVTEASLIPVQSFATFAPAGPAAIATWIISVRGHGVYTGGGSFTTAWFQVPVDVCVGCLAGPWCTTAGSVIASCPSTAPGQTSPGQTANYTCVTLQ